jgi:hypothetical protein
MKSIDKAILGMVSESSGCNESERIGDDRKTRPQAGPPFFDLSKSDGYRTSSLILA